MIKLLDCIPKKIVTIGEVPGCEIYEGVRIGVTKMHFHQDGVGYSFMLPVPRRSAGVIVMTDRYKERLQRIIARCNRRYEEIYVGDSLRYADEDTRVTLQIRQDYKTRVILSKHVMGKGAVVERYTVRNGETYEEAVERCGQIRLKANQEYNKALEQQRAEVRDMVERHIRRRSLDELANTPIPIAHSYVKLTW